MTPILLSNTILELNSFIRLRQYNKIFILVDYNTHKHCLPIFLSEMETDCEIEIIEIPQGEDSKVIEIVTQVWETLVDFEASRKSLMINLGGGVVTDLGGFIAATFKRGIKFINVPTTLLSQVDASVGGKTGINLNKIKNAIGTFSQPEVTLIDPNFLNTLPERELKSGLAEMLKHGLIREKCHWDKLIQIKDYRSEITRELIMDSIRIKSEVVSLDLYENGLRKILNFGHTIGHALESYYMDSKNPLLHGEAIAVGMMVESVLSYENELISLSELNLIFYQLSKIFGSMLIDENSIPEILKLMRQDKKKNENLINFSLISGIGTCKFDVQLPEYQIELAIQMYNRKLIQN